MVMKHTLLDLVGGETYEENLQSTTAMSWIEKLITLIRRIRRGLHLKLIASSNQVLVMKSLTRKSLRHGTHNHTLGWRRLTCYCKSRNRWNFGLMLVLGDARNLNTWAAGQTY